MSEAAYQAAVIADGAHLYLPMLYAAGAARDFTDHSGNAIPVSASASFSDGAAMQYSDLVCPVFSAGRYLTVPAMLGGIPDWTVEWWQGAEDQADQVVFSERGPSGTNLVTFIQEVSGTSGYRPTLYYQADTGSKVKSQPGNGLSNYRSLNHFVLQRWANQSRVRLMINGGRRGNVSIASPISTATNASRDLRIGADRVTGGGFRGRLCRFAVYLTVPLDASGQPDDSVWANHYELGVFENPDALFHPSSLSPTDIFEPNSYVCRALADDALLLKGAGEAVGTGTKYQIEIQRNLDLGGAGIIASDAFSAKLWDVPAVGDPEAPTPVRMPYVGGRYSNTRANHETHWQSNGAWPVDDRIPGDNMYANPTDGPLLITQVQANGKRHYWEAWKGRRGFPAYAGLENPTFVATPTPGAVPVGSYSYRIHAIRRSDDVLGPGGGVTVALTGESEVTLTLKQPQEQCPHADDKFDFAILRADTAHTTYQLLDIVTNPGDTATTAVQSRVIWADDGTFTPTDTLIAKGAITTNNTRLTIPSTQPFEVPYTASTLQAGGNSLYLAGVHVTYAGNDGTKLTGCTTTSPSIGKTINAATVSTPFMPGYDTHSYPMTGMNMALGNKYQGPLLADPDLRKNRGTYRQQPTSSQDWGSAASGIPVWAGMITLRELQAAVDGEPILHNIRCAIARGATTFVYPASRSDGLFAGSQYIQYGSIFRFPPGFDVDTLGGTNSNPHPFAIELARVIRDYGMTVTDKTGGGLGIFVESQTYTGRDYQFQHLSGFTFGEALSALVTDAFWAQMVVVDPAYIQSLDTSSVPPPTPPTAAFNASPTSGNAPLSVTFTDTSTGSPTTWAWDFGDGASFAGRTPPAHVYATAGSYTARLTAANTGGSTFATRAITVTTPPPPPVDAPVAAFNTSPSSGQVPLTVDVTDTSTNTPTSWLWTFGDGTTSTAHDPPDHVYTVPGIYTIKLTATNAGGSDSIAKTITVTDTPPPPVVTVLPIKRGSGLPIRVSGGARSPVRITEP